MGFVETEGGLFKNWIKSGQSLSSGAGIAFPALLTTDNYPINGAVVTSNIFISVPVPQNVLTSDDLVFKCTNVGGAVGGDIQIARGAPGFDNVVVSSGTQVGGAGFNLTMKGTNPRVVFRFATSVPTGFITVNFLASGTFSGCSNMVLCKLSDEAAIDAATTPEEVFYQPQIDFYLGLNCKVFRPMGWAGTNNSNVSRHAYRVPWQNGLTYQSQRWEPTIWAGTVSGTNTYTATRPSGVPAMPTDGAAIQMQFTNANTSTTVTLDLGGSWGVKTIFAGSFAIVPAIGRITANQNATLVYDAILDVWLHFSGGLTLNIPIEVRLGFANACGVNYWHNFPTLGDDASAVAEATYVRDNLSSGKVAYFEYTNEPWNPLFSQYHTMNARGLVFGFPSGDNRRQMGPTGLRIRQLMGQVVPIWNGRTELRCVNAFQGAGPTATKTYQFDGGDLNTSLGYAGYNSLVGVSYNAAPSRPIDFCSVLSYANYVGGAQTLQFDSQYVTAFGQGLSFPGLLAAADDYDSGNSSRMAQALAWMDYDLRQGVRSDGLLGTETMRGFLVGGPLHAAVYPFWNGFAESYSPEKFVELYEGCSCAVETMSTATCTTIGISTSYGGPTGKVNNLINAYKQSPLFAQQSTDCWNEFMAQSQSTTPAWLIAIGPSAFGLMQGNIYSAPLPSATAMIAFNNATFGRLR